jgi:hypothetical protein
MSTKLISFQFPYFRVGNGRQAHFFVENLSTELRLMLELINKTGAETRFAALLLKMGARAQDLLLVQ